MLLAAKSTEALLHLALLALLGSGNASNDAQHVLLVPLAVLAVLAVASEHLHWRWLTGIERLLRRTHSPGFGHGLVALPMLLHAALSAQGEAAAGQQPTRLLLRACTFSSFLALLSLCFLEQLAPRLHLASSLKQQQRQAAAQASGSRTPNGSHTSSSDPNHYEPNRSTHSTTQDKPSPTHQKVAFHPALLIAAAIIPCLVMLCRPPDTPHAMPNTAAQHTPADHTARAAARPTSDLPTLLAFAALHHALLAALLHHLPGSFTLSEATLLAQAAACTAALLHHTCAAHPTLLRHLLLDHWSSPASPAAPASTHPALIPTFTTLLCSLVLLACASASVLVHQASAACAPACAAGTRRAHPQPAEVTSTASRLPGRIGHPTQPHPERSAPGPGRRSVPAGAITRALAAGVAALVLGTAGAAMASLAAWVLRWLAAGPAVRLRLLQYWVAVLAGGLPLMVALLRGGRCPHIIVRKGYHLLAVALFLPAAVLDLPMLAVSLAIGFALLAALEALRAAKTGPLARAIDGFMSGFTDARDAGPLYLTHFTLLLGMAVPVWLAAGLWPDPPATHAPTAAHARPLVAALSGVMCLGLGDTAASAIGYLWGRHRLFVGSSKTWEGTLAGFAATLAGWLALSTAKELALPGRAWAGVVGCSAAASLLEAATVQLDNLFVPMYYLASLLAVLTS